MDREQLEKILLAQTQKLRDKIAPPDEPKLSEKGKRIRRILTTSDFGCYGRGVALLVSELIGEKIQVEESVEEFPHLPFACAVCTANPNSHDYGEGVLCARMDRWSRSLRPDGSTGNTPPAETSYMRPATDEEIRDFLAYLPDETDFFGFLEVIASILE